MMIIEKRFFVCHTAAGHKYMWIFGKRDVALVISTIWRQAASDEYEIEADDANVVQAVIIEKFGGLL